jgi:ferredoxin-NADP reductase
MARTAVTVTPIVFNTALASPAGVNADATNDHVVTPTVPLSHVILRVTHTAASAKTFTVKAGDNPPAVAHGGGDLVVSFAAGDATPVIKYFVLASDRFQQDDGTISVDLEAGFTGSLAAFSLPAGA